ncbi:hypothetical protein KC354_g16169 [Hortaea werneckii]|uniref:Uncharacterized protein n=1 Tax=Hortaea werneckii TaxID=91943 RepID=A0A3M7DYW4_HORWE|nr:hypothetical protein KC354_g16169 [Hortaea werneckii]RMY69136.1 hypothetical protein D0863_06639 [Hortaea werneckii]
MATFTIEEEGLTALKDTVVVVTGGSSGIGLATTSLLLKLGAAVVIGDINPPPAQQQQQQNDKLSFVKTDVSKWEDLVNLFKHAKHHHRRIDHVFANAGISSRANYLEDHFAPDTGDLLEPSPTTLDINLRGVINTAYLGMHYMRTQTPQGGSVVLTASASSFQRFRVTDYTTAKHGVLGFMRGLLPALDAAGLPIRVNALAPDWTATGIIPPQLVGILADQIQGPEVVAKAAALCMVDQARQGQLIYSRGGVHREVEEGVLMPAGREIVGKGGQGDDAMLERMMRELMREMEVQQRKEQVDRSES